MNKSAIISYFKLKVFTQGIYDYKFSGLKLLVLWITNFCGYTQFLSLYYFSVVIASEFEVLIISGSFS